MSKDENINFSDPLFLVSRDLDGDLSARERILLDELLSASPELRVQANQLRTISQMVDSSRKQSARVDWKLHEKLVLATITEKGSDLAKVDDLLAQWGQREPAYDQRALAQGVMARISPARNRRRATWRLVARLGAPLAAAAVLVLAVVVPALSPVRLMPNFRAPVTVVQIGPAQGGEENGSVVIVSFAKPAANSDAESESLSFGYMTLGSSPIGQTEESPL